MHLAFVRHALAAALLTAASCFAAQPVATPAAPARANASSTASIRMPASNPHVQASPVVPAPPSQTLGELYRAVELAHVFPDGKTFADRVPKEDPARIAAAYEAARGQPGFDLRKFVDARFAAPRHEVRQYVSDPKQTVVAHIDTLWDVLRRDPDSVASPWSSLLPLPASYVVPGGRFDEIYYWDSYFIMLGLRQSGREDLLKNELDNFAVLIDRYGHIPNGNRTYYLSRSQPPFFAQMVRLAADREGDQVYLRYLPQLRQEYAYWMDGHDKIAAGSAYRHLVRLPDGTLLNRYWDERATPRDESYREDVATAQATPQRNAEDLWRNLRAGGETGWDFN